MLEGDYNQDGAVDAADYVVWRDTHGQSGVGLPADGDSNNIVDDGDYQVWRKLRSDVHCRREFHTRARACNMADCNSDRRITAHASTVLRSKPIVVLSFFAR